MVLTFLMALVAKIFYDDFCFLSDSVVVVPGNLLAELASCESSSTLGCLSMSAVLRAEVLVSCTILSMRMSTYVVSHVVVLKTI